MPLIGIGAGEDAERIVDAAAACRDLRIAIYAHPGTIPHEVVPGLKVIESANPEHELVDDLFSSGIDAAVRGTLPANTTLSYLKEKAGVSHLERVALLETPSGDRFLLAPVGVDEGWTARDQVRLVEQARALCPRFGLPTKVAVLSGGRYGDVGRHNRVDRSLGTAELVARITGSTHCEICIEDAVPGYGVVIAPDGIAGNLIFRTLTFLGGGRAHGAPVVNINPVFIDTSRASREYLSAIRLACALVPPL